MQEEGKRAASASVLRRVAGFSIRMTVTTSALLDERGQDLIEYALVVALIALAATVSMSNVATALTTAFSNIGSHLAVNTS